MRSIPLFRFLIIALFALLSGNAQLRAQNPVTAQSLKLKADSLQFQSQYAEAATSYRASLEVLDKENFELRVSILHSLADALMNQNKTDTAQAVLEESLSLAKSRFGEESKEVAQSYYYLGKSISNQRKRFPEALDHLKNSLSIGRKLMSISPEVAANALTMIGVVQMYSGKYQNALTQYDEALKLFEPLEGISILKEKSRAYYGIGWINVTLSKLPEALISLNQSLEINQQIFPPNHGRISTDLRLIGICYTQLGQFDNAIRTLNHSLEIQLSTFGKNHANVANTYIGLARLLSSKGEYNEAIDFTKEAIRIRELHYEPYNPQFLLPYINLADYFSSIGQNKDQLYALSMALKIGENAAPDSPNLVNLYLSMGQYYLKVKDFEHFDRYIEKSELQSLKLFDNKHPNYAIILREKANGLAKRGENQQALILSKKVYKIINGKLPRTHITQVHTRLKLGDIFSTLHQPDSAILYYNEAIAHVENSGDSTQKDPEDYSFVNYPHLLTEGQFQKGMAYRQVYEKTGDLETLKLSLQTFRKSMVSLESTRNRLVTRRIGLTLFNLGQNIYNQAAEVAYTLYTETKDDTYQEDLFNISERSKAFIFLKNLDQKQSLRYGSVPDSLLQKDLDLLSQMRHYNRLRLNAMSRKRIKQARQYSQQVFELKRTHQKLQTEIEELHPDFFGLRYKPQVLSLKGAQATLKNTKRAIITFIVTDSGIISQTITANEVLSLTLPKPKGFASQINDFRRSYTDYSFLVEDKKASDSLFITLGNGLYEHLIAPISSKIEGIKELIIVPHSALYDLNFELLQTTGAPPNFNYGDLSYLARDFAITYASSYTVHDKLENISHKNHDGNFGGFATNLSTTDERLASRNDNDITVRAPGFNAKATLKEVQDIADLLGGDSYLQEQATEENFKNISNDYKVVHLAMHGDVDNENPFNSALVFSKKENSTEDGFLTMDEIYGLDLKSDLIVLSACNTGYNKQTINGEGMTSMSRSFMFSGVPSLIMSLWAIPDQTTAEIMVDFYQNLESGTGKSQALQKAKLNYLENVSDDLYAHPYFWAGLSQMGNTQPLHFQKSNKLLFPLIFSILVLILAIILLKKRGQGIRSSKT